MGLVAAKMRAERINIHLINTLALRRVRGGVKLGDRAAAGAARAPVDLVDVTVPGASVLIRDVDGRAVVAYTLPDQFTAPGYKTARRCVPHVLARLDERDARRIAADLYAQASEKIGAVAGVSAEGQKTDGGQSTNDGGVTTRIEYAAKITAVEAVLARAGVVLSPKARGGGSRRGITARELMDAICLEALDMKTILTRAGWSGQGRDVAVLNVAAGLCLELMARRLGLAVKRDAA